MAEAAAGPAEPGGGRRAHDERSPVGRGATLDPELARWVARAEPSRLRSVVGLTWVGLEPGMCEQRLTPAPGLLGTRGLSPAGVAFLVDSTLGTAAATAGRHSAVVTVGLRVELVPGWVDQPEMVARGRALPGGDGWLLAVGELLAGGTPVGTASIRCRPVEPAGGSTRRRLSPGARQRDGETGSHPVVSVEDFLGVRALQTGAEGSVRVAASASPGLANGAGTLHGGAVAGLGHWATCAALDAGRAWLLLGLEVDFVRAIAADGAALRVEARVVAQTRSLAWSEAIVVRHDGCTAARVRCRYAGA